jgi:hypothetical protein
MTIEQTIDVPGVTASRLARTYTDAAEHAAAIGAPVDIEPQPGGRFAAYGGLTGRILLVESRRLVQTWRANVWRDEEPDSILVLSFEDVDSGGRIRLLQADVPERLHQTIADGWRQHYWSKWTQHLTARR